MPTPYEIGLKLDSCLNSVGSTLISILALLPESVQSKSREQNGQPSQYVDEVCKKMAAKKLRKRVSAECCRHQITQFRKDVYFLKRSP